MLFNRLQQTQMLDIYTINITSNITCPYTEEGISAGFPSPAADHIDIAIDLNKELIKNPSSTFFGRVKGDSMQEMGIEEGDLLVIDKSIEPVNGKIAVCYIDGEFTMKRIQFGKDHCWLIPANERYSAIKVTANNEFIIWGIVIHVIKSF